MVTRSTPASNKCVAKQWRRGWMPLPFSIPLLCLARLIDLLGGADVQGLISAFTEEDPQHRLIGLLVFLHLAQQALGKNRVTVFFPFALFHPNHHAFRIDIAEFKMDQLSDSKSRRVRCHQQTPV